MGGRFENLPPPKKDDKLVFRKRFPESFNNSRSGDKNLSRIGQKFSELKGRGQAALMPFLTIGDPNLETTCELLLKLDKAGADLVELGIPFSDPIADGPTIQRASQRALRQGVTPCRALELVRRVRRRSELPISLMTYYNLIFHYGEERFVAEAAQAGVDGLIVPDLPPEEAGGLRRAADRYGLDIVFLLAPTSRPERVKLVAEASRGFIYYVSLTGVTGARERLAQDLAAKVREPKRHTDLPVAVGFGISTPEQAGMAAGCADGVIVGSALINVLEANLSKPDLLVNQAAEFVGRLKAGMRNAGS